MPAAPPDLPIRNAMKRIVVDTTNPIIPPGFTIADPGGLVAGGRMRQFPGGPLPGLNLVSFP